MDNQDSDFTYSHFGRPLSEIAECSEPQLVLPQALKKSSWNGSRVDLRPMSSSNVSLPANRIPRRISSGKLQRYDSQASGLSAERVSLDLPPPNETSKTIPQRRYSVSPVRKAAERGPLTSDIARRKPSKTFVRRAPPVDILNSPSYRHSRVQMHVSIPAPLLVGGGTLEGQARLIIDGGTGRFAKISTDLFVARLSVDLLGVEEATYCKKCVRRCVFLSIANELITDQYPPPRSMAVPATPVLGNSTIWKLLPSVAMLPFSLNLPLNTGPPPCQTKYGGVRYVLSATLVLMASEKWFYVRQSQPVTLVTVRDPETTLLSLPTPLTSSDELEIARGHLCQTVKLTAGIHRQIWVSGLSIFVDVHVSNSSDKAIKKLEIQLEKSIILYLTAAASTKEVSAGHLRIPDKTKSYIVRNLVKKKGSFDWKGVGPKSLEARTYELQVPSEEFSSGTATHFEIRYFLNIRVTLSHSKSLKVSLPIILVHPNSVDVIPNAVAQVASALANNQNQNARNSDANKEYVPGRVFNAPRRQSLCDQDQKTISQEDITDLTLRLNGSPRRMPSTRSTANHHTRHPSSQSLRAPKLATRLSGIGIFNDEIFTENSDSKENMAPRKSATIQRPESARKLGVVG
ncbi:MAG: hypothetical protein M1834_009644 [Cirrosporium novae-zelandiae]|nr:MAG: hypothetical protein M1834_009644 [Cirrosporium novae-zelandiae]